MGKTGFRPAASSREPTVTHRRRSVGIMRDAARLQATIEILDTVLAGEPADRVLHRWARQNRYAGSKDRAAIADRLYMCLRRLRSLGWPLYGAGTSPGRAAVIGAVISEGLDPTTMFDGQKYGPQALTKAESQALARPSLVAPAPVRLDYQDWLDGHLRQSLGERFEATMAALQARAPVDLRVNLLHTSREDAAALLAAEGIETETVPLVRTALRAKAGAPVKRTAAFRNGLLELQDAASQAAVAFAEVQRDETVLDFCAGGGGKALALADAMAGSGRVIAHDAARSRMRDLPVRAARAGVGIDIVSTIDLPALEGQCDLVFVDAPCAGTGSWRRDPGGKWRLTPARLDTLVNAQRRIVAEATRYVAPRGRLVYCLCSLLEPEAEAGTLAMDRPPSRVLTVTPDRGSDGFYCALW